MAPAHQLDQLRLPGLQAVRQARAHSVLPEQQRHAGTQAGGQRHLRAPRPAATHKGSVRESRGAPALELGRGLMAYSYQATALVAHNFHGCCAAWVAEFESPLTQATS